MEGADGDPGRSSHWYSYVVGIFIFALGVIAIRRQSGEKNHGVRSKYVWCSALPWRLVAPSRIFPRTKLRLINIGYPVFRFKKDVVVNNKEVPDEQARLAELSQYEDTGTCWPLSPKYHTYVVVIGESARRDAMGSLRRLDNTPGCQLGQGTLFTGIMRGPAARRRNPLGPDALTGPSTANLSIR